LNVLGALFRTPLAEEFGTDIPDQTASWQYLRDKHSELTDT